MKKLVEVLAKSLVDFPDEVVVKETEDNNTVNLELVVNPEDMGKIIGKHGRIAKAIRTILKSTAMKQNKRANLEIIDKWK